MVETDRVETHQQLETRVSSVDQAVEDREVETVVERKRRGARVEPDLTHPLGIDRPAGYSFEQH